MTEKKNRIQNLPDLGSRPRKIDLTPRMSNFIPSPNPSKSPLWNVLKVTLEPSGHLVWSWGPPGGHGLVGHLTHFQIFGAFFQPIIGMITDRHPAPYSPVLGMIFTLSGLVSLAFAKYYELILISVALIGIGSSIFHPEATRMARYAAGGQQGLALGIFQVGGQSGGALGPLFAALIIVPWGLSSLSWFSALGILAIVLLFWIGKQQHRIRAEFSTMQEQRKIKTGSPVHGTRIISLGLFVLTFLMFIKNLKK